MAQEPIYGFVRFSECYHRSKNCPVIRHVAKSTHIEVQKYGDEKVAFKTGHLRRCKLCMGDKVFDLAGNDPLVRLTDKQFDTMVTIVNLHKKHGPLLLKQVAEARSKSVVSTHLMLARLRAMGLVEHKVEKGAKKASNRSIAPSIKGIELVSAKQLD